MITVLIEKKDEKIFLKRWKRVNGNGSNGSGNNSLHLSPVVYQTSQIGEKVAFSIGHSWAERIEKKLYSYKVVAAEDVIIPAGVYKCYKVMEEAEYGIKNFYWFSSNVGLVKWEMGNIKGILQDCLQNKDK